MAEKAEAKIVANAKEEAEEWIAAYEKARSKVPKDDS